MINFYFDSRNQDLRLGPQKLNGFDTEITSKFLVNNPNCDDVWQLLPRFLEKLTCYVSGREKGRYYYPIDFDWRLFCYDNLFITSDRHIKIPQNVIDDAKQGFAKILCVNPLEGFALSKFEDIIKNKILSANDLDWNHFVILSGNCVERSHSGIPNIYYNGWEEVFDSYTNQFNQKIFERNLENIISKKKRTHKFVCLARRPRDYRLAVYANFYPYRTQGILTLGTDTGSAFNMTNWFNSVRQQYPRSADKITNSLKMTIPRQYDVNVTKLNPTCPHSGDQDIKKYEDSYLHVVCETHFRSCHDRLFFSEKIIKPLIFLQPFVLFGAPHSLKQLKKMGFETFSPVIDESYDDIEDDDQRLIAIVNQVEQIISLSDDDLNNLYLELLPRLIHNYFHLKSRVENAPINLCHRLNCELERKTDVI